MEAEKEIAKEEAPAEPIRPAAKCEKLLRALRAETNIDRAAKDLLQAANLPLLPSEEPHVDDDLKRIHKGKPLAPVLLLRGDMAKGIPLKLARHEEDGEKIGSPSLIAASSNAPTEPTVRHDRFPATDAAQPHAPVQRWGSLL